MPEKRRTRATGGQVKVKRTTQTTLKDLLQKTNSCTIPVDTEKSVHPKQTDTLTPSFQVVDARAPPSRLFPIFTKAISVREGPVIADDTEVIDITDASSDVESLIEPPISPIHRSKSNQITLKSPPPSNIRCCNDTDSSHVGHTRLRETSKRKESNKRAVGCEDTAPLPSSYSQHVRGTQHSFTSSRGPLKRSVLPTCSPSGEDFLTRWRRQLDDSPPVSFDRVRRSLTPQERMEHLRSLSRDYTEEHPAFARISVDAGHHAEMWTRHYRPRRANEVLGNERHALYLRDWFRALELQMRDRQPEQTMTKGGTTRGNKDKGSSKKVERRGVKRPRVVRTVTKKRGNKKRRVDSDDDLDDFVVFSDADEEPAEVISEDSEDEAAFCQRTLARLHRRDIVDGDPASATTRVQEPIRTDFAEGLTNTLLITGPSGCGKTAAVYACAEELGWDVLEVYPGIGRRNGASLDQLVGEVGKNHMVPTVRRGGRMKGRGEGKERKGGELWKEGCEARPISVDREEGWRLPRDEEREIAEGAGKRDAGSDGSRAIVRQSVVLLEEVDILFEEDAGFWGAVVEFIGRCQRPVVMTCNDPGLVPVGDLPLQRVLVFEACPSRVAATFLACVSVAEGWLVPHEDLMALYERTDSIEGLEVVEGEIYARAERDLRRAITELQMLCAGARHGSAGEEGRRSGGAISGESWQKMKRESEVMSHADAELVRVGVEEEEGGEEEEGRAMGYSRGETGPREGTSIAGARVVMALKGVVDLAPERRSTFVDYIPWVRHMVAVDDELEGRALCRRGTRNSLRTVHARNIGVDSVALTLLRETRLRE